MGGERLVRIGSRNRCIEEPFQKGAGIGDVRHRVSHMLRDGMVRHALQRLDETGMIEPAFAIDTDASATTQIRQRLRTQVDPR